MALQFIDGFDHYSNFGGTAGARMLQKWDATFFAGQMFADPLTGRFVLGALRIESTAGSAWVQKSVITARDEMLIGFAYLPNAATFHITNVSFQYDDAEVASLQLNPTSGIITLSTTSGASVNTVGSTLTSGVWQYIEFKVKIHATLGTLEIKHNEVSVASNTGLNTGTTGALVQAIRVESTSNLQEDYIDDLYLADTTSATNNNFLGDSRVSALYPKSNGAVNDFSPTPATSDNFEVVNELKSELSVLGAEQYVESGLIGARENYVQDTMAERGLTPSTIFGVQVVNSTLKTDAGTLRFKNEMTIAGVQFNDGTEVTAVTGAYKMATFIRDTDPSDSAAWTEAKVDAVGSGCAITFRQI